MNDVTISGRLVKKPKTHMVNNSPVCNFTIALSEYSRSNSTNFIDCVAWGKIATNLEKYQDKGDMIEISGFIFTKQQEFYGKTYSIPKVGCNSIIYVAKKERRERKNNLDTSDKKKKLESQDLAISENSVEYPSFSHSMDL